MSEHNRDTDDDGIVTFRLPVGFMSQPQFGGLFKDAPLRDNVPEKRRYLLTTYASPYDGNHIVMFLEERRSLGILSSPSGGSRLSYVQTLEPEARDLLAWIREHGSPDGFFLTGQPGRYDLTREAGDRLTAYMQKVNPR